MTSRAPSGSNVATPDASETDQDLQSIHALYLCRLFLPSFQDFVSEPDFGHTFDRWWARHIVLRVQSLNFQYDMVCGKSALGVGACGGNLELNLLMPLLMPVRDELGSLTVNSFDLAALIQLGAGFLLDNTGKEVLKSKWFCKFPYGLMNPCMPLGADTRITDGISWPPGVNNPYLWDTGMCASLQPY